MQVRFVYNPDDNMELVEESSIYCQKGKVYMTSTNSLNLPFDDILDHRMKESRTLLKQIIRYEESFIKRLKFLFTGKMSE